MAASKWTPTEYITVKGKISWLRAVTPDKYDKWAVNLHPDAESLEKIRELQAEGIKNGLKKDDDGYFVNFSRPINKKKGETVIRLFNPPEVVDAEGQPLAGNTVGNGSDAEITLEVYGHPTPTGGHSKAARLSKVKVLNLIPYTPQHVEAKEQSEAPTEKLF